MWGIVLARCASELASTHVGHEHLDLYSQCDAIHAYRDLTLVCALFGKKKFTDIALQGLRY